MEFLKKSNSLLIFLFVIFLGAYFLHTILIPFGFGIFLAMLIAPLTGFLESKKVHKVLSSLISTLILFISLGLLSYLFIYQIGQFAEELPDVRDEIQSTIENLQRYHTSDRRIHLPR